jgi:hypothetical protein
MFTDGLMEVVRLKKYDERLAAACVACEKADRCLRELRERCSQHRTPQWRSAKNMGKTAPVLIGHLLLLAGRGMYTYASFPVQLSRHHVPI